MGRTKPKDSRSQPMIGPVLHQELLLGSRRNRLHIFRWIYAGWLVFLLLWFYLQSQVEENERWYDYVSQGGDPSRFIYRSPPQVVGGKFVEAFVLQQMILLLLATPPLVAGAITDEKRRGTLQHLLT